LKKIFSNIRNQLILGITLIVLLSTILISIIFITQYKNLTLMQIENEIADIATEFAEVGKVLINPNQQRPRRVYMEAMRNLSNAEVWIISVDNQILLDTTEKMTNDQTLKIIEQYGLVNEKQIIYDYSDYFNNKTMSIVKPIVQNGNVALVLVHKDVDNIYASYDAFNLLVYFILLLSVLVSVILAIFFANYYTKPLNRITETAKKIKSGNYQQKTKIKRDDQIGELAENLDLMSTEIDQKIKEVHELEDLAKELVSNVSHEFKTPLTLINGYAINLRDKIIRPNKKTYDKIINNTEILEKLVNNLLEINNYQSGNVKLNKENLDLKQLLEEVVSDMKIIAKEKKIKIKLLIEKNKIINADSLRIKQLLMIFIDNAIKYSEEKKEIVIKLNEKEIAIIDQGIGIESSKLEKIFQKYYKIEKQEIGYGLGLFIAKQIIDLHGYALNIQSDKNKGTVVQIKIED